MDNDTTMKAATSTGVDLRLLMHFVAKARTGPGATAAFDPEVDLALLLLLLALLLLLPPDSGIAIDTDGNAVWCFWCFWCG